MLPSMGVNEIRILNHLKSIMRDIDLSGSTIMNQLSLITSAINYEQCICVVCIIVVE